MTADEIELRRSAALERVFDWIDDQDLIEEEATHGLGLRAIHIGGGLLLLMASAADASIRPRFKAEIERQFGTCTPILFEP
ncbi:MAG: hypothetical protein JWN27_3430 [Candidatus Eremiobacteraeota bacterium]|nr:hypothetical protein [Candidatus Eremiobacteraeota bacterium]